MNSSKIKKRARDLQAITGMGYQAARRAVTDGTAFCASLESGYEFRHFVTPDTLRTWLTINHPGEIDCANHRHYYPTEQLGECIGCGRFFEVRYTGDGEDYDHEVSEEEYLERCARVGMYYEWAPSPAFLRDHMSGITQGEYRRVSRAATPQSAYYDGWSIEDE